MAQVKKTTKNTTTKTSAGANRKPKSRVEDAPAVVEAQPESAEPSHDAIREALLVLRERLTGTVTQLRAESLTRDDEVNPEEDGSDAFERLFSLERASSDHHTIHQIDEALHALEEGTYGKCEMCGCDIEPPRLKALPFAKTCVGCQSEMERMRGGFHASRRLA